LASRSAPGTLLTGLIPKSPRIAASRSPWDGKAGTIYRLAAHWSKLNSYPKTAAPCSGFDIAAFRKRRRLHSAKGPQEELGKLPSAAQTAMRNSDGA
jgi:hypothetical protein